MQADPAVFVSQEVMLDLETMSTDPNAAIIAIGAVHMDFEAGTLGQEFYAVVDLESSVDAGGILDASTVLWWLKQSDEARSAFKRPGEPLPLVLQSFAGYLKWIMGARHPHIWGNGAAFDNVILAQAYKRLGLKRPWDHKGDRCYRTMREQFPASVVPDEPNPMEHNALEDAKAQARHLLRIQKHIRGVQ